MPFRPLCFNAGHESVRNGNILLFPVFSFVHDAAAWFASVEGQVSLAPIS